VERSIAWVSEVEARRACVQHKWGLDVRAGALGMLSCLGNQEALNNKNKDPGLPARWGADNNKPSCGALS
jgi:hypothetical protein